MRSSYAVHTVGRVGELLVVGHGMVGHRLVRTITERDRDRRWPVTVIGAELRPAYDRVALSSYVDGPAPRTSSSRRSMS